MMLLMVLICILLKEKQLFSNIFLQTEIDLEELIASELDDF